jgi:hypothetical protein
LGNRLARADRERAVLVREFLVSRIDEFFARDTAHRIQHALVAHAAPGDLSVEHPVRG